MTTADLAALGFDVAGAWHGDASDPRCLSGRAGYSSLSGPHVERLALGGTPHIGAPDARHRVQGAPARHARVSTPRLPTAKAPKMTPGQISEVRRRGWTPERRLRQSVTMRAALAARGPASESRAAVYSRGRRQERLASHATDSHGGL
jgi:hypothetical protein